MPRLPRLRGREVISALKQAGFVVLRIKGSHHVLGHADGRRTVVPVHADETIGPGLIAKIIADAELDLDSFRRLL